MLLNITKFSILTGIILVSYLFTVGESKGAHILDDGSDALKIESIAKILCNPGKKYKQQISRISTVIGLNEYFKTVPASHTLSECSQRYGLALEKLSVLVSKSNENVCSEEKISLIEEYHNDYLSTILKYKDHQKKNNLVAPILLKTFFTHYASEVSAICEKFAIDVARKATLAVEIDSEERVKNAALLDKKLKKFSKRLMINNVDSYEDIFFVWTLFDNLQKNDKLERFFSDGSTKMSIMMKNARETQKLRSACLNQLKPAYEKITLPVLRLISLGYYPKSTKFLTEIKTNSFMKRLYTLTHFCELLLPVKVYENGSLSQDKIVLITQEEANKLPTLEEEDTPIDLPVDTRANSLRMDKLKAITAKDAIVTATKIKHHIVDRSHFLTELFKLFLQDLKSSAKSSLSLSMTGGYTFSRSDLESSLSKIQGIDLDNLHENPAVRKRRGFMRSIKDALMTLYIEVSYFIYTVLREWLSSFIVGIVIVFYYTLIFPIKKIFKAIG